MTRPATRTAARPPSRRADAGRDLAATPQTVCCAGKNCTRTKLHARGLCQPCYRRDRFRGKTSGTWSSNRVDAGPVREHVGQLQRAGLTIYGISRLAGLNTFTVQQIVHGQPHLDRPPTRQVTTSTAARIMAIEVPDNATDIVLDAASVPGIGTARRVRAMVAFGYPLPDIAHRLGKQPTHLNATLDRVDQGWGVSARLHRDVQALFGRLQMTPGPSDAARELARQQGWHLPFEWDEDALDDPAATAIDCRRTVESAKADAADERRDAITQTVDLTAHGHSAEEIAEILGVSDRTVLRYRREAADIDRAIALAAQGRTTTEIAELLDVGKRVVTRWEREGRFVSAATHVVEVGADTVAIDLDQATTAAASAPLQAPRSSAFLGPAPPGRYPIPALAGSSPTHQPKGQAR